MDNNYYRDRYNDLLKDTFGEFKTFHVLNYYDRVRSFVFNDRYFVLDIGESYLFKTNRGRYLWAIFELPKPYNEYTGSYLEVIAQAVGTSTKIWIWHQCFKYTQGIAEYSYSTIKEYKNREKLKRYAIW